MCGGGGGGHIVVSTKFYAEQPSSTLIIIIIIRDVTVHVFVPKLFGMGLGSVHMFTERIQYSFFHQCPQLASSERSISRNI